MKKILLYLSFISNVFGSYIHISNYMDIDMARHSTDVSKYLYYTRLDLSDSKKKQIDISRIEDFTIKGKSIFEYDIESINLSNNDLGNLEEASNILVSLSRIKSLKELILSHNNLGNLENAHSVLDSLTKIQSLEKLNLEDNELDDTDLDFLLFTDLKELDLSYNNLETIPLSIVSNEKLTTLKLSHNKLTVIPEFINSLKNMVKWEFSHNKIEYIPDSLLNNVTEIHVLDFSYNKLTKLPNIFTHIKSFYEDGIYIYLDHNNLIELPESFGSLEIQFLDLSHNNLTELPESFFNIKIVNNATLDLSYNKLTKITKSFDNIDEIDTLNLSHNNITELPGSFGHNNPVIENLDLSYNQLIEFPQAIYDLGRVAIFNLSHNKITSLPDDIYQINLGLREGPSQINFSHNLLTEIPEGIFYIKYAHFLNISHNPIKALPHIKEEEFDDFRVEYEESNDWEYGLCSLDLSYTNIKTIPNYFKYLRLQGLNLSNTSITKLPDCLRHLVDLNDFDISHNKITTLPEYIGDFNELDFLNISHNYIEYLPESFCKLINLKKLNLSNNKINSIPDCIGVFSKLISLNLSNNHLLTLPYNITNLKKLDYLNIYTTGAPLVKLRIEPRGKSKHSLLPPKTSIVFTGNKDNLSIGQSRELGRFLTNLLNKKQLIFNPLRGYQEVINAKVKNVLKNRFPTDSSRTYFSTLIPKEIQRSIGQHTEDNDPREGLFQKRAWI